jgi:hypothetical protein
VPDERGVDRCRAEASATSAVNDLCSSS